MGASTTGETVEGRPGPLPAKEEDDRGTQAGDGTVGAMGT